MSESHDDTLAAFERALSEAPDVVFELTLIVSGASDLSSRAIANARALCDTHLQGRSTLSIVDLRAATGSSRVVAAPTLVRESPLPVLRLVGDLSQTEKVLQALELRPPGAATPSSESG